MSTNKLPIVSQNEGVEEPWYSQGLRFKCTGCGRCCTGSPGVVWVTEDEIVALAEYLSLSLEDFVTKYIRLVDDRFALEEDPKNYDCVFLKDKRCTVYEKRPSQCRTYPWWVHNLTSKEEWLAEAMHCEGINHKDAPLVPYEEIKQQLHP